MRSSSRLQGLPLKEVDVPVTDEAVPDAVAHARYDADVKLIIAP